MKEDISDKIIDSLMESRKNWCFEIFDCESCNSRFAIIPENNEFHENYHSDFDSPYSSLYEAAKKIEKCKTQQELKEFFQIQDFKVIFRRMRK